MKRLGKTLILWVLTGMCYSQAELFARGFTYLPMTFIGGAAITLVGQVSRRRDAPELKMWQLCALGMLIILDTEYVSGCFFNLYLRMDLWSYSGDMLNLNGQICLRNAALWFALVPFAVWIYDFLRWKLFGEERPDACWQYYYRLVTLR